MAGKCALPSGYTRGDRGTTATQSAATGPTAAFERACDLQGALQRQVFGTGVYPDMELPQHEGTEVVSTCYACPR